MTPYHELAPEQRTAVDPEKLTQTLVKRLEHHGFIVTLEKRNAA
jgi:hypothetical protein